MRFKTRLKIENQPIDITPLVDVVFQLIIFFMLSSSFVLQPGIKVELPTLRLPLSEKPNGLSLTIRRDGSIFFKDHEIQMSELGGILTNEKKKGENELLVIKADQKAFHGRVVEVMGMAKEVGFSHIAIATKPEIPSEVQ